MPTAFELSDDWVDTVLARSPMTATNFGIAGVDDRWDDLSPAAHDEWARLRREVRTALAEHVDDPDPIQAHAARVLAASLDEELAAHEAGDHLRDVNHIYCPVTELRDIFDIMDRSTATGWANIAARLERIGEPLAGYRGCLAAGIAADLVPSRRQVESVIEQMRVMAGEESAWNDYPALAAAVDGVDAALVARMGRAVESARGEVAVLADWFVDHLSPVADPSDGVGEERYRRNVDRFLGDDLDLEATYEWGWQELDRIWAQMHAVAAEIDPDVEVREVIQVLQTDPAHSAPSPDAFVQFVQARLDAAVEQLDGTHFDLPDKMKRLTVNLAPPGGALGAWYINPSEDFTRPGSVWYSLGDKAVVPLWSEVSTAYHEGFPGHHLQVATVMDRADVLSRAHRMLVWYPGYGEGWALYTERLMDELGFLERPEYRLGMLATHAFRASRVVVDLGLHLGYPIPQDAPLHAGGTWDFDTAVDFMATMGLEPRDVATSEVKRYLGWPAQAISYKLGEKAILELRDELQRRGEFDLRAFHDAVLDGGPLRLDMLRERLLG